MPEFDEQSGEDDAAVWAQCLLEAGPALTHIGVIMLQTTFRTGPPRLGRATKAIARVLLSSQRLRSVTFRYVCTPATQQVKDDFSDFVQRVSDFAVHDCSWTSDCSSMAATKVVQPLTTTSVNLKSTM